MNHGNKAREGRLGSAESEVSHKDREPGQLSKIVVFKLMLRNASSVCCENCVVFYLTVIKRLEF